MPDWRWALVERTKPPGHGFTLIELLVALTILSLLALISWRGLDGMVRAQQHTRQHANATLTLQTTLAQWNADLDAMQSIPHTQPLAWDGKTLKLTRRSTRAPEEGVWVVAWTLRAGHWLRWQSPPLRTRAQWQAAWQHAEIWGQQTSSPENSDLHTQETRLLPLHNWQLFYWRGGAWANALSSASSAGQPRTAGGLIAEAARLPEGVRLQLTLASEEGISGTLTRDWASPLQRAGR